MIGFVFSCATTATLAISRERRRLAIAFGHPRLPEACSGPLVESLRRIGVWSSPADAQGRPCTVYDTRT